MVSCSLGWPSTHNTAEANLELLILPSSSPRHCVCLNSAVCLLTCFVILGTEARASHVGKGSATELSPQLSTLVIFSNSTLYE